MGFTEFFEEAPPEQARELPHRQEETRPTGHPRCPVGREPATGHDAVHVGMMGQRRTPGVQDQRGADLRAQVLRISSDPAQGLGGHIEQQTVEHGLVGVGDPADRRRQREHHVVIRGRQQIGLAGGEPAPGGMALALRAMPVAAGVVRDLHLPAFCLV